MYHKTFSECQQNKSTSNLSVVTKSIFVTFEYCVHFEHICLHICMPHESSKKSKSFVNLTISCKQNLYVQIVKTKKFIADTRLKYSMVSNNRHCRGTHEI